MKYSSPILLQLDGLLHHQSSHQLQSKIQTYNVKKASSITSPLMIDYQPQMNIWSTWKRNNNSGVDHWTLTEKAQFHQSSIYLQHFPHSLCTFIMNSTAYHSFIQSWWHKYEISTCKQETREDASNQWSKHTFEVQDLQWSILLQSFCNSNGSFISNCTIVCSTTHNKNNNTINIPPSVNIHSLRVNIFNQRMLDDNRRGRYVQWILTLKGQLSSEMCSSLTFPPFSWHLSLQFHSL